MQGSRTARIREPVVATRGDVYAVGARSHTIVRSSLVASAPQVQCQRTS